MSDRAFVCAACRITRPTSALIRATMRSTGRVRHVCRPSLADRVPGGQPCFAILRSAIEESIELATAVPRAPEQERHAKADRRRSMVAQLAVAGAR
jgi:hypothetical protein